MVEIECAQTRDKLIKEHFNEEISDRNHMQELEQDIRVFRNDQFIVKDKIRSGQ